MRICRIVDSFPAGKEILGDLGPNYYYYAKGTTANGFEEHIICTRKQNQPEFEKISGINVHRVASSEVKHPRRDMLWGSFAKNSLQKVLELKPDLVVGHNALHYGISKKKDKLKKAGIKLASHIHTWVDMFKKAEHVPLAENFPFALRERFIDFTYFLQFKEVLKNSDFVIACDKSTKENILGYFPGKDVSVVYNGVSLETFKPEESNLKQEFNCDKLLLNISRPVPWKGIQYLLKAMPEINKEFPNTKLLLLGFKRSEYSVYTTWLEGIAKKLNLDNVIFYGRVPYFDLPKYYNGADCFIAPSHPDPSPKTVYEAQACNTPVVGTNSAGIPEVFSQKSGLLFQPKNIKDLASKTIEVLNNPQRFKSGRDVVREKATWGKCIKNTIKTYEKIVSN